MTNRTRRIQALGCFIAAVAVGILCVTRNASGQAGPGSLRPDDAAIYALVLDSLPGTNFNGTATKVVVVSPIAPGKRSWIVNDAKVFRRLKGVDTTAIRDYRRRVRHQISLLPLRDAIAAHMSVKLEFVTPTEMSALERRMHQGHTFMEVFGGRFPGARAVVRVSSIGYGSSGTQAIIMIERDCGFLCAIGDAVRLDRVGTRWHVTEDLLVMQS